MDDPTPGKSSPAAQTSGIGTQTPQTSGTGGDYTIPAVVLEKYPELVELIKKTESMSPEERDYWFQILPIMTEDQVKRLKTILEEEAAQLAKLDTQYQDELAKLNKKHLEEWNIFEKKKEREALQAQEAGAEVEEKKAEEDILKQLDTSNGEARTKESTPPSPPNA